MTKKTEPTLSERETLQWLRDLLEKHEKMRFTGTLHIKWKDGILLRAWRRHNG